MIKVNTKTQLTINFLSVIYLLVLGTVLNISFKSSQLKDQTVNDDIGRNERSTPRAFILPATPAVALIQEKKKQVREEEYQIKHCMLKLHDNGYSFANFEDIQDIKIVVATVDYQKRNNLPLTGEFDSETRKNLGCE